MDRHNILGRIFPRLAAVAEVLWTDAHPSGTAGAAAQQQQQQQQQHQQQQQQQQGLGLGEGQVGVEFPAAEYYATAWYLEEMGIVGVESVRKRTALF
jgi:hypothetical protein